jgi:FKBP-type peptidyl-prolyl cis-trans isomerase 2
VHENRILKACCIKEEKMKKARKGDTVVVDFSGLMENGTILSAPLRFTIGKGNVLPAIEDAVIGLSPGERKTDRVPPQMVFGEYREDMIREVQKNEIPHTRNAAVGAWLEVARSNGEVLKGLVRKITDSTIFIDTNHPMAGNHLHFSARLLEIVP